MSLTVHTNKTKYHLSTTVAPYCPRLFRRYCTSRGNVSSFTQTRGHLSIHDMFLPTRHFPNLSYTILYPSFIFIFLSVMFSINSLSTFRQVITWCGAVFFRVWFSVWVEYITRDEVTVCWMLTNTPICTYIWIHVLSFLVYVLVFKVENVNIRKISVWFIH